MFTKPPPAATSPRGGLSHSNGNGAAPTPAGSSVGNSSSPSKISSLRSNFETPGAGTQLVRSGPASGGGGGAHHPISPRSAGQGGTSIPGRSLPVPGRTAPPPPGRPTRIVTATAVAKPKPGVASKSGTGMGTTQSRPTITTTAAPSGAPTRAAGQPLSSKPSPVFTSTATAATTPSARAAMAAARSPHPARTPPLPPKPGPLSTSAPAASTASASSTPLHLSSKRERKLDHGIGSIQGKRPTMEDKHIALHKLPGHPHIAYFGVYDGHAGAEASEFVAETLHVEVNEKLSEHDDWKEAVIAAYSKVDEDFMEESEANMWESGTTVITAMIDLEKKQILLANLGDCRCILVSATPTAPFVKATALSEDHKPWVPGELARIEAAGCTVEEGRINGTHAMSRAIGDFELKQNISLDLKDQAISNLPEFRDATISNDELFLVLACDGLWDVMKNDEVAEWVYPRLYQTTDSLDKIATDLANHAVNIGSTDNVTCCIVLLP